MQNAETLICLQYLFKFAFNHLFSRFSEREYICVGMPENYFTWHFEHGLNEGTNQRQKPKENDKISHESLISWTS